MRVFLWNVPPSRSQHARLFQCLHLSRFLMLLLARLTTGWRRRIFLMKDSELFLSLCTRARTPSPESWNRLNRAARHNQDAHRDSRIATGNETEKRERSWKPEGNCSRPRGTENSRYIEGCLQIAMFSEDARYALNRVISPADLAVVAEFPVIRPRFSGVRLAESRTAEGGLNNRAYIGA